MGFATTIAQLTQQSGRDAAEAKRDAARIAAAALTSNAEAQSHAAAAKGAIWGKTISDIGQSIADIPSQINRSKALDLQRQDIEAQVAERKAHAAKVQQEDAENQQVDRAFQESLRPDGTVDLQSFSSKIPGSKQQVYLPLIEKVNAAAETTRKNKESTAAHAFFSAYKGGTPASLVTAAKMGAAAGAMTPEDVQQIQQIAGAIASGPAEAQEGSTRTLAAHLGAHFPQFQDLLEADKGKAATQAHLDAQTRQANATADKTAAEVAGTLPETPAQKDTAARAAATSAETTRHNQATEAIGRMTAGRAEAAQAETARHNRAMEDSARNKTAARPVLSSDANRIADIDTSIQEAAALKKFLDASGDTGALSQLEAAMPNFVNEWTGGLSSGAKSRNAQIALVRQIIGKGLEGGVLRKEDEIKYKEILPTIGDAPEVVKSKLEKLDTTLRRKRETHLESLSDAGFNVGKLQSRQPGGAGASMRQEIPGHPGKFAVSKDGGKTWTAE